MQRTGHQVNRFPVIYPPIIKYSTHSFTQNITIIQRANLKGANECCESLRFRKIWNPNAKSNNNEQCSHWDYYRMTMNESVNWMKLAHLLPKEISKS